MNGARIKRSQTLSTRTRQPDNDDTITVDESIIEVEDDEGDDAQSRDENGDDKSEAYTTEHNDADDDSGRDSRMVMTKAKHTRQNTMMPTTTAEGIRVSTAMMTMVMSTVMMIMEMRKIRPISGW